METPPEVAQVHSLLRTLKTILPGVRCEEHKREGGFYPWTVMTPHDIEREQGIRLKIVYCDGLVNYGCGCDRWQMVRFKSWEDAAEWLNAVVTQTLL